MDGALGVAVLVTLGVAAAIDLVWMGLALGALLRKLGGNPTHAWVPVLRWAAAAREARVAVPPVLAARSVEFIGAVVSVVAWILVLASSTASPGARIALIVGLLLWIVAALAGWVMWIYGAGTIELRLRVPRRMTWLAALAPAIWASVMGWGPYQAIGRGVTAHAAAAGARDGASGAAARPVIGRDPAPVTAATSAPDAAAEPVSAPSAPAPSAASAPAAIAPAPSADSAPPAPAGWVTGDGGVTVAQRWEGFNERPLPPVSGSVESAPREPSTPVSDRPAFTAPATPPSPATPPAPASPVAHDGAPVSEEPEQPSSEPATAVTPLPPGWSGAWAKVTQNAPAESAEGPAESSADEAQTASPATSAFEGATEFPDVGDVSPATPAPAQAGRDAELPASVEPSPTDHPEPEPEPEPELDADGGDHRRREAALESGHEQTAAAPALPVWPTPPARDERGADSEPVSAPTDPPASGPPTEPSPVTAAVPHVPRPSAASPYVSRLAPTAQEPAPDDAPVSSDPSDHTVVPEHTVTSHTTVTPQAAATPETSVVPDRPAPQASSGPYASHAGPTFSPLPPEAPAAPASASGGEAPADELSTPALPPEPREDSTEGDPRTEDEVGDHTVIASRRREAWVLEVEGGASYGLGAESVVLGRSTAAAIPGRLGVDDPTRTLSKLHAELEPRDGGWWVRDLGSTNGTYVRAADGTETEVGHAGAPVDGDLILGDLVARIVTAEDRE